MTISDAETGQVEADVSKTPTAPRLVKRNLPFHQSKSRLQVKHNQGSFKMFELLRHDWFHVILGLPMLFSLTFLLALWTLMILIFAGIYVGVDAYNPTRNCGLGTPPDSIHFPGAFAFSLETCTTVGYGMPGSSNAFFENCAGLQFVIYWQMVWSMLFNAFLFAFFYSRLAKSDNRGIQVVMSSKAIVSVVDGQARFQVRVYDVDARHPVLEAHVRLYAVAKERPVPRPLRLLQPNDDYGGMLFLSFPYVISHHIDVYSLLHPPVEKKPIDPSGLFLRQVDSVTCNREDVICPICGESYGSHKRWEDHVRYQKMVESKDGYPKEGTHLSITEMDLLPPLQPTKDMQDLQDYFGKEISEIICVVEGIDPLMSGTFQALHSYQYEDIVWHAGAQFTPCLDVEGKDIEVDMDLFHEIDIPEEVHGSQGESDGAESSHKPVRHRRQRSHDSFISNLVDSSSMDMPASLEPETLLQAVSPEEVDTSKGESKAAESTQKPVRHRRMRSHDSFISSQVDSSSMELPVSLGAELDTMLKNLTSEEVHVSKEENSAAQSTQNPLRLRRMRSHDSFVSNHVNSSMDLPALPGVDPETMPEAVTPANENS